MKAKIEELEVRGDFKIKKGTRIYLNFDRDSGSRGILEREVMGIEMLQGGDIEIEVVSSYGSFSKYDVEQFRENAFASYKEAEKY